LRYTINLTNKKSVINKNIYGHFAEHLGRCVYEGLFVGEDSPIPNTKGIRNDVAAALRNIKIPVLRWPGGCFADEYHWKDGIGPKENRKNMVNTHWGGVIDDNSFGTHEFMELCEQIETEPYINGNLGSGTVQEMQEWVEYLTSPYDTPMAKLREQNGRKEPWKVKYFGVGNENWGCGGHMRPEFYADEYRRYQTYVRGYGENKIYKIACGANGGDLNWTDVMMRQAGRHMHGLSLHYYTITHSWQKKGSATQFTEDEFHLTINKALKMENIVDSHSKIMDRYDPDRKVGMLVDEWGTWHDVEPGTNPGFLYQQNTMRDALVAGLTLNIFNKHSARVVMANLAQTINVLQAVVLTEGAKMALTPTYHVFDMYKGHQDATLLESYIEREDVVCGELKNPLIHESASIDENGNILVTLCNLSLTQTAEINSEIAGCKCNREYSGTILTGKMNAYIDFDTPENVKIASFNKIQATDKGFDVTVPPCSVVAITIKCNA